MAVVTATLVAGCATPAPVRFYTLQAPAPAATIPGQSFEFALQAVRVPPHVDVLPLLIRSGSSALTVVEGHQWGAPLALEWRTGLSAALTTPHGGIDLARAGVALAPDVPVIRVDVQRFDSLAGEAVQVAGVWSLSQAASKVTLTCAFSLSTPVGPLTADIATGHQRLVADLALQMAGTLTQLRSSGNARCPG